MVPKLANSVGRWARPRALVAWVVLALSACSGASPESRGAALVEFDPNIEAFTLVPARAELTMALGSLVIVNKTSTSVHLVRIEPVEYDGNGIQFLGIRAYRNSENPEGGWELAACGFPPRGRVHYPVSGFQLRAGETVGLYIGVKSRGRQGQFAIRDFKVTYTTNGLRHTQRLRHVAGLKITSDSDSECDPLNRLPAGAARL